MNRTEHLQWAKDRALKYVAIGDNIQAFASFASDVSKHDDTKGIGETIEMLGMPLLMMGALDNPREMRKHIEGYN